jgi:DNA-binding IscR family transcriptional regulator
VKPTRAAEVAFCVCQCLACRSTPASSQLLAAALGQGREAHAKNVLGPLTKAGILRSVRGPRGGYLLARDNVTLLELLEAIEGPLGEDPFSKVCRAALAAAKVPSLSDKSDPALR